MRCARDTFIPKSWTTSKLLKDQLDPPVGHVMFLDHQGCQLDPPVGHVTVSWPIAFTAVINVSASVGNVKLIYKIYLNLIENNYQIQHFATHLIL